MSDTAAFSGFTKKYNIPLDHFEYKYINNCTDAKELERIYKELISGEIGSFSELEQLTLNRIRDLKPNSLILRKDKDPLDKSALPDDEREDFYNFLHEIKGKSTTEIVSTKREENIDINPPPIRTKSIISQSFSLTRTEPVKEANSKAKRVLPRSYDEWGKLDKKLAKELNSDDDDNADETSDDNSDSEKKQSTNTSKHSNVKDNPQVSDHVQEKSQRLKMAEQHRLNGNTAFKSNDYQKSIELYTKCITLDSTNMVAYMNRAIAYFKLNKYEESIADCSKVLNQDPMHIKALYRRASCLIANQKYDDARQDLDALFHVDPENAEAKDLLKTIPNVQKSKGIRIPITEDDDDEPEQVDSQSTNSAPVKIPILEVEEEEEENEKAVTESRQEEMEVANGLTSSMNIDIPQKPPTYDRPCIGSQDASPTNYNQHFNLPPRHHDTNQFQEEICNELETSAHHTDNNDINDDDDDDMMLGDEAAPGHTGNISDDDDGNMSQCVNVSPMNVDDDEEYVNSLSPLNQPPTRRIEDPLDQKIVFQKASSVLSRKYLNDDINDDENHDLYEDSPTNSFTQRNGITMETRNKNQRTSANNTFNDPISNSNFSLIIQNWLRDSLASESHMHSSIGYNKPWTKEHRPYVLDKIQRDIERFNRLGEFNNAIEASKKMLKNGLLDYHKHADHLVSTLLLCAQAFSRTNRHIMAIQYATEALQFNKSDTSTLMCRAKAFESENFLLFSYADYSRIPLKDYNYKEAQSAREKLAAQLNQTFGASWQDKVPTDDDDAERYFSFIKEKDSFSDKDDYEWHRERGNQLYMDACFVLAIQCYTHCIGLKENVLFLYSNRAACYLKMFEPHKTIDDCNQALKLDQTNLRALYRKACAYKMLYDDRLYERTLQEIIKLEPNNQIILSEYYGSRREQIPREKRRIRPSQNSSDEKTTTVLPTSNNNIVNAVKPIEQNQLTYDELERIRKENPRPFSTNTPHHFIQQLQSIKASGTREQCSLTLRLPEKNLFKVITSITPLIAETIIRACYAMVQAEKQYQQQNKSSILPYSYTNFCFNILVELTKLPRIDSAISTIDVGSRTLLDDLLTHYKSVSSAYKDVNQLDRLRT